ncbi:DUF1800 domain-containing protein [Actinokineospora bangkokensis]|uniref:DUF1800 domain-containing protein n=1 Tax=Actinokineospora bangkokensis TaxID=1193682 RepID=A0A1Q9LI74_9PSEU|nr:DUF1800 family protein [Actinokineospora bangkokensis]OLR91741.1 hypothetical protein BJP25_24740 [Actinokineospora bangkokensis]
MTPLDDRAAVRRLLDRLALGPRPGDLDRAFGETLDRLLAPPAPVTPPRLDPLPRPAAAGKGDKGGTGGTGGKEAKRRANAARAEQERRVAVWWLDRLVADTTATERLTWFWHGHFATSEQKVRSPRLMLVQNQALRAHATGSFTDLATAMVTDPALLLWLDGNDNRAGAPNENLAREFLELFALGIGHYTETDVREAAKALTGWRATRDRDTATFDPDRHERAPVTLFGDRAPLDAPGFVARVLARPESARFVVGRLWFRLVSAAPPPADALDRVVAAYGPGRDTAAALRAITAEPAFRDPANTLVKQPVDWFTGLCRALGVAPAALPDKTLAKVRKGLTGMGQVPLRPPSVGGWPAAGAWLTTSAGAARLALAQAVVAGADLSAVGSDPVEGARTLLGVDAWSPRTTSALEQVRADPKHLVTVAACAPEYVVSG